MKCGHGCLQTDEGAICVCPEGSLLQEDGHVCTGMNGLYYSDVIYIQSYIALVCQIYFKKWRSSAGCMSPDRGGCSQLCTSVTLTGWRCSCLPGYRLHHDGKRCIASGDFYPQQTDMIPIDNRKILYYTHFCTSYIQCIITYSHSMLVRSCIIPPCCKSCGCAANKSSGIWESNSCARIKRSHYCFGLWPRGKQGFISFLPTETYFKIWIKT